MTVIRLEVTFEYDTRMRVEPQEKQVMREWQHLLSGDLDTQPEAKQRRAYRHNEGKDEKDEDVQRR